ncbi:MULTISPECIES: class I SAM-dependent methyltransferase [unclassified Microbacterium]|uniref:class I SAM-dependent methyltransferase n=1 Tax=unclassified Microbacterium TaxID=2609290 RepID=UPI003019C852
MDLAELTALLTPEGLRLIDELGALDSTDDVAAAVSRLRSAGRAPELVAAAVGQARLRTRARAKFGAFADRMLFTRSGLEQATRLEIAASHAGRFRDAGIRAVADLGCGIGGDALALAGIGLDVLAVDADEVTAALAAYNLAPFGDAVRVRHARAQDVDLAGIEAVWLDPARRTAGHGDTTRLGAGEWSPPLDWVWGLAAQLPAGIKLGPAFDRSLVPTEAGHVETQWISVDGATIELVVWTGVLARPGISRAALVVRGGAAAELTADADAPDANVRALGEYLHEPEGAVIRARLIGDVARTLGAGMIDEKIAYLTSDAPVSSPFVQSFRIREQLPNDVKALARALRERGIGTLEIKKRGVDIDPATLRTKLKLRGSASATLIVTRVGDRRLTLLADRL